MSARKIWLKISASSNSNFIIIFSTETYTLNMHQLQMSGLLSHDDSQKNIFDRRAMISTTNNSVMNTQA